jgi:hypothetical protein
MLHIFCHPRSFVGMYIINIVKNHVPARKLSRGDVIQLHHETKMQEVMFSN